MLAKDNVCELGYKNHISIEHISKQYKDSELAELCDIASATIVEPQSFNIGFHRWDYPDIGSLEKYFKGVILIPERETIVAKLDGSIVGLIELVKPYHSNNNAFAVVIDHHFVAPWARGHGITQKLLAAAEQSAKAQNFTVMRVSIRADQSSATGLYEKFGYNKWGVLDKYLIVNGKNIAGYFYYKDLND
jgi:L-amino acid N-acyltransferase YncA